MGKRAVKFTPQVLLSAPRRSVGVPNSSLSWVLHTVSTYSFETHKKTVELRALNASTGDSHVLAKNDDISDLNWLNEDEFACLKAESDGTTSLCISSVGRSIDEAKHGESRYVAGKIAAPASNLKLKKLPDEDAFAVVLSAQASPDGTIFNPEKAPKTQSTGKLFNSLFVRHWDSYVTKEKTALWYGKLSRSHGCTGEYHLSKLTNALVGTGIESPCQPFGGTDHFDVSPNAVIFVAKDPELDPALNTKCNVYLLRINSWEGHALAELQQIIVPGFDGAKTCPCFNSDGSEAAFLSMKAAGYEADKNQIFIVGIAATTQKVEPLRVLTQTEGDGKAWDRSAQCVCFSADGSSLIVCAEDECCCKVFLLQIHGGIPVPWPLTKYGYISDVRPLANGQIFVSGSSLVDNSFYAVIDVRLAAKGEQSLAWTNSNSAHGAKFGLKNSQVSSIWTPASNPDVNKIVHSIVVRPSNFSADQKYPVAYLIHGGPQGAWGDSWSTRWNPAVFAEQGYIVICPNPTGSTGYGQQFTDSIRRNWGGDPYVDIVNVFNWVGEHMPEADNEQAVALGASYGGYMMNWIQGHDLGRKFKAIVCHDGITSFAGLLSTEELYFPFHDLGGTPWYDPGFETSPPHDKSLPGQARANFGDSSMSAWRKWDPSEHFANWSTPQLVIHSSKDYRLAVSEGLAAFNVLQARGVPSQFLTFPDENHWVLKPENSLVWHKVVLNWINQYAGLPAFSDEDPQSMEFFGGRREEKEEVTEMPSQGQVET